MGRCFEPICIDKALAALAQAENAVARKGTAEQKTSDGQETAEHGEQKQLVGALQDYLAAAKLDRTAAKLSTISAANYRRWFQDHPAPAAKGK